MDEFYTCIYCKNLISIEDDDYRYDISTGSYYCDNCDYEYDTDSE